MTDQSIPADARECPFCAEVIKTDAVLCKHCRSQVSIESDCSADEQVLMTAVPPPQQPGTTSTNRTDETELSSLNSREPRTKSDNQDASSSLIDEQNQWLQIFKLAGARWLVLAVVLLGGTLLAFLWYQGKEPNQLKLSTLHDSVSFGDYWIGMSLDDFEKLPLPRPRQTRNQVQHATLVKHDNPNIPAVVCSFDGADLSLSHCPLHPQFIFCRTPKGFQLVGIEAVCDEADEPKIEGALSNAYGHADAHTATTQIWTQGDFQIDLVNSHLGICQLEISRKPEFDVFRTNRLAALEKVRHVPDANSFVDNSAVSYEQYRLGMSLEEFKRVPLPKSKTASPFGIGPGAFGYFFKGNHMQVGNCNWVGSGPGFSFYKTAQGYKLIQILGKSRLSDVDKIADALTDKYGLAQNAEPLNSRRNECANYKWVLPGANIIVDAGSDPKLCSISFEKQPECLNFALLAGNARLSAKGNAEEYNSSRPALEAENHSLNPQEHQNVIETLSAVSPSSAEKNPTDSGNLIEHMLQAKTVDDEDSFNEAKSRIEAVPKPAPGDTDEATKLNKSGLANLKAKKYDEASADFQSASAADPSDAKYLSNLAYAEMHAGNLDSAQKDLYASIALDPSRSLAWGDLGLVFAKKGERDKAAASLLIGYKVSNGETLGFLQSLSKDDDANVKEAGRFALAKVRSSNEVRPPSIPTQSSTPYATSMPPSQIDDQREERRKTREAKQQKNDQESEAKSKAENIARLKSRLMEIRVKIQTQNKYVEHLKAEHQQEDARLWELQREMGSKESLSEFRRKSEKNHEAGQMQSERSVVRDWRHEEQEILVELQKLGVTENESKTNSSANSD